MMNIVRFWLDIGVDGFRVDAVPVAWRRQTVSRSVLLMLMWMGAHCDSIMRVAAPRFSTAVPVSA